MPRTPIISLEATPHVVEEDFDVYLDVIVYESVSSTSAT